MKLQAFDFSYFRGKKYFEDDSTQNYLGFQPVYRYFKTISYSNQILAWKSKGLTGGNISLLIHLITVLVQLSHLLIRR